MGFANCSISHEPELTTAQHDMTLAIANRRR